VTSLRCLVKVGMAKVAPSTSIGKENLLASKALIFAKAAGFWGCSAFQGCSKILC